MHDWTMTYPYLTFFLILSTILLVNNLVVGIVNSGQKFDPAQEENSGTKDDDQE